MEKPQLNLNNVELLLNNKYMKIADIPFAGDKHYYVASRRKREAMTFMLSDEQYAGMTADAVTCIVIIKQSAGEARLLLNYEYRYPCGQFLLSPTAGLIDAADLNEAEPLLSAARREIFEETGIKELKSLKVVSPLVFSTPGMSDESNALVCAVAEQSAVEALNRDGAEATECFGDFVLLTKAEALDIIRRGVDAKGGFMPVYTWAAIMYFLYGEY